MDLELRPSARRVRTVMVTACLVFGVFVLVTTVVGGLLGLLGCSAPAGRHWPTSRPWSGRRWSPSAARRPTRCSCAAPTTA